MHLVEFPIARSRGKSVSRMNESPSGARLATPLPGRTRTRERAWDGRGSDDDTEMGYFNEKGVGMRSFRFCVLTAVVIGAMIFSGSALADSYSNTIEVFKKSPAVQPFFANAYGYAVFPTIGKGGFVVGAAFGRGRVYRQGAPAGAADMIKGTVGLQLGGQAFSEIIFFQDKRAYEDFTSGTFEFDATMSAVAITAGAQAKAGTEGATAGASAGPATGAQAETSYRKGMAVFIHAKGGLMYEAAIGGQKFTFKPDK